MAFGDDPLEPVGKHMGVDLGGRNVGMAQHLLHRPQVRAMGEEMACEGMAQHMRRDPAGIETGPRGKAREAPAQTHTGCGNGAAS